MKISELKQVLSTLPDDSEILISFDGEEFNAKWTSVMACSTIKRKKDGTTFTATRIPGSPIFDWEKWDCEFVEDGTCVVIS